MSEMATTMWVGSAGLDGRSDGPYKLTCTSGTARASSSDELFGGLSGWFPGGLHKELHGELPGGLAGKLPGKLHGGLPDWFPGG